MWPTFQETVTRFHSSVLSTAFSVKSDRNQKADVSYKLSLVYTAHNEVHTCCISIKEVTYASAVSSRKKIYRRMRGATFQNGGRSCAHVYVAPLYTIINVTYKHMHKQKKLETIPFSYAYVTPGLHS